MPHNITASTPRVALLALAVGMVAQGAVASSTGLAQAPPRPAVEALVTTVARVVDADYRGDREALRRLHGDLGPVPDEPTLASRVLYWRGFALWRRSINGFNDSADRVELDADLRQAVVEFEQALLRDPAFIDASTGLASCLGLLTFLHSKDQVVAGELIKRWSPLMASIRGHADDNPRLAWVLGQSLWFTTPTMTRAEVDERQGRSMDMYRRGLSRARAAKHEARGPLDPAWGEPELLMNLAWASLNKSVPDIAAAEENARAALALVPHWHYVRDILLPQIEQAK